MSLQGKVALITGGTKNLGAEIARQLAAAGASLALHYNTDGSRAAGEALVRELGSDKVKVELFQADLRTEKAVDGLFDGVVAGFGRVDVVVNTVGKVLKRGILEVSEGEYDDMFA
ncbi:Short-chain type dehydrogenase/reductase [Ophiocordyceps camponoti-floridani]|uniref:Short-chain type dehydrogenase/reductase n=1 Tax=Ophiocordyceps camponoti-floridani TaxID=2030778 RepID=A0A8H4VAP2_9HYPO|nr:Short-chain type dehydrogenase/reductase [Ophiocordyceps camponoti-floridani]